jgi:hypothetical protein
MGTFEMLIGRIVMLAINDSFVRDYVGGVLQRAGASVFCIAPGDDLSSHGIVDACVAGPHYASAACKLLSHADDPKPVLLLIDAGPCDTGGMFWDRLDSPFAAHQVVDAIAYLLLQADMQNIGEPGMAHNQAIADLDHLKL